jgi:hypothetical protein
MVKPAVTFPTSCGRSLKGGPFICPFGGAFRAEARANRRKSRNEEEDITDLRYRKRRKPEDKQQQAVKNVLEKAGICDTIYKESPHQKRKEEILWHLMTILI